MESNQQSKALVKATNSWNTSQNPKIQELEKQQNLIDHEKNYTINTNGKRVRVDDNFVFPPGYRFCPHDEELILHYLKKKVMNELLPHDKIKEVNLYRHSPQELSENYSVLGEKEWYFFTPRDRKYPNGDRPNRAAGTGYWKATGADKHIIQNGVTIGFRKALVFYEGKPPKGDKTNWIMHEFRVNESRRLKTHASDMRLDDWVLCRIYKKVDKSSLIKAPRKEEEEEEEHDQEIAGKCDSPVGKVENCDYEEPIDSFARQQFDTPHQYNTDPNYPYFMINNPDCFSDYGARLPNYGVNLPSFPPGNMLGSCQGQESNIFNYYQNHYGGEIDYHNVLNIVGVLEENSSIVGVLDENLSMFGVLDENSSIDKD